MKWFVKGDIDGFFGLAVDNLIQVLLIASLCGGLLGFPVQLIFSKILPGVAVSLLIGNLFYAWQAMRLSKKSGRSDICALPYGINTPSAIIYIFLVMAPVKFAAMGNGVSPEEAAKLAWQVGLAACLGSGVIELVGSFVAEHIRRLAPRAALLSTLSGIALGFISLPFLFQSFAHPLVGLSTFSIILLIYFGQVRFKFKLPGGFVAVLLGTLIAWATGLAPVGSLSTAQFQLSFPVPLIGDLISGVQYLFKTNAINIIIPMGFFNVLGSLQNIESAEAAGDTYQTKSALLINGAGTVAAALFGSCFPTTIYIGHPGWKALGARAGYSILNALFFIIVCLTGTISWVVWAVPMEAGGAIVLWIGIIITSQAFQATPRSHAPAAVIGIMVGVGAWGAYMAKAGMRSADALLGNTLNFSEKSQSLLSAFEGKDVLHGALALEQGSIFTAMIFAAMTVCIIEKQFIKSAIWCGVGALLSSIGLLHSYGWEIKDTALSFGHPAWEWAMGYGLMGVILLVSKWTTTSDAASR